MGGIKNRDAKRAAAKVFSSAGGGGAKGPSVIDKRGQEEKCPHCDRIFKQNNRLKEHIAKQHADQLQQEQPATLAAVGGQASASSSSGRPSAQKVSKLTHYIDGSIAHALSTLAL